MVAEKYAVRLSPEDQAQLERLIRRGQHSARVINRARILLKTDDFAHFKPRRRVNPQVGGTGQPGLSIYPVLRLDFVQKLDKL